MSTTWFQCQRCSAMANSEEELKKHDCKAIIKCSKCNAKFVPMQKVLHQSEGETGIWAEMKWWCIGCISDAGYDMWYRKRK